MKLLQICIEVNSGSVGRIAEQIGNVVLEKGWESYITYARKRNPSNSQVIKIGNDLDIYLHGITTRLLDKHGFASSKATLNLIDKIISIQPDVIHLHHLHGYYINIKVLFNYLKDTKIPIVWTFHDCWSFTGHCTYFDNVGCEKWKTECHNCELKGEYPKSVFLDRSRNNFIQKKIIFNLIKNITIVSVSKWLSSKVKESFFKDFNLKVIYNGIDIEKFYPKNSRALFDRKFNSKGKFLIIGVATTWEKRKGLQDFIELNKILDSRFLILLIGLADKQIEMLPNSMLGIKRTESQDELCSFYSAADLFLNLSVEETFGLTTAEALACGTPAIVYDSTACPELIDENTGILVQKNNIKELVSSIEKVYSLGKTSYTNFCRQRAVSLFDQNVRFTEYYNLYNELIHSND